MKKMSAIRHVPKKRTITEQLHRLKLDPVKELVDIIKSEGTPARLKADICMELLTYVQPRASKQVEQSSPALFQINLAGGESGGELKVVEVKAQEPQVLTP